MRLRTFVALGVLLSCAVSAQGTVRIVVKDGRKLIYNDGVGESSREALRYSDNWLATRVNFPSLYDRLIEETARAHSIDPKLVKSVMLIESAFNPGAVSRKGARGLMQLMPATAHRYGVRNIHDPAENISGGTRYLSYLLGLFNGNLEKSLAAYNAGESAVARYGGIPPYDETRLYVRKGLIAYSGKSTLTGGFGLPPNQTWSGVSGRPVRLARDKRNRPLLTTDTRRPLLKRT